MLSVFPQILFLSPLAATLLRLAAALTLLYIIWKQGVHRDELARTPFPVVGEGAWIVWVTLIIEFAVAVLLAIGLYTQVAALVGALMACKFAIWDHRFPHMFPLTRIASLLLLVIMLSLVVTGAGAFAFDLPL